MKIEPRQRWSKQMPVWHGVDCPCGECERLYGPLPAASDAAERANEWALYALAGTVLGNLIAFAWDARGALDALAAVFR